MESVALTALLPEPRSDMNIMEFNCVACCLWKCFYGYLILSWQVVSDVERRKVRAFSHIRGNSISFPY